MEPTLGLVKGKDYRYYLHVDNIDPKKLSKAIEELKFTVQISQGQEARYAYLHIPCGHLSQYRNPLTKSPTYCQIENCRQSVETTIEDKLILSAAYTALQAMTNLQQLLNHKQTGSVDVTDLFILALRYTHSFTLDCGHSLSQKKLGTLVGKLITDPNAVVEAAAPESGCKQCYRSSTRRIIAYPNRTLRKIGEIITKVIPRNYTDETALKQQPPTLVMLLERFNAKTVTEYELDEISGAALNARSINWEGFKIVFSQALHSGNYELLLWFFELTSQLAITDDFRQFIAANLANEIEDRMERYIHDQEHPVKVAEAVYLFRLACEFGYDDVCPDQYQRLACSIIDDPSLVFFLTDSTLKNLEFLISKYPVLVDSLLVRVNNLERFLEDFSNFLPNHRANIDETITHFTKILADILAKADLDTIRDVYFYSALIDFIGTDQFLKFPDALRYNICVRLLMIFSIPSYLDLKLLDQFDYVSEEFIGSDRNFMHSLFGAWLERCRMLIKNPNEEIPSRAIRLESLDGFVKSLKISISKDLRQMKAFA